MPAQPVWVAQGVPAATSVPVDVIERASPDKFSTLSADPLTGTTLAVNSRTPFPQVANFKVRVENETMLVTGGMGLGAGSLTVTRGYDNTTTVAHAVGLPVSLVVGVQRSEPVDGSRQVSFKGRACTYRTPGRAVTTGQKLFAIHNAAGSPVIVDVHNIMIDMVQAAPKLMGTLPPLMRVYKFTAVPTNGTELVTKAAEDASLISKTAVRIFGDASSDGTSSTTTLTIAAIVNGAQTGLLTQMFAPRYVTPLATTASSVNPVAELMDRATFFDGEDEIISLRAAEGLAIYLDYTAAIQNPITDMWSVAVRWVEYAPA